MEQIVRIFHVLLPNAPGIKGCSAPYALRYHALCSEMAQHLQEAAYAKHEAFDEFIRPREYFELQSAERKKVVDAAAAILRRRGVDRPSRVQQCEAENEAALTLLSHGALAGQLPFAYRDARLQLAAKAYVLSMDMVLRCIDQLGHGDSLPRNELAAAMGRSRSVRNSISHSDERTVDEQDGTGPRIIIKGMVSIEADGNLSVTYTNGSGEPEKMMICDAHLELAQKAIQWSVNLVPWTSEERRIVPNF